MVVVSCRFVIATWWCLCVPFIAKQAGIDKCIKQLEIQQKNIFQFKPENYEQQLDKACDCKYGDVKKFSTGGDDPTTVCDAKWVHNCRIPSAGGACMNAMGLMVYDGYCESTGMITLREVPGLMVFVAIS